jgi:2-keto-3-deoxy-L-rhamnonate aldolase RhmA
VRSLAIVRIHKSFAHLIPGILDQGIMGIQVSEVETAREARAIVRLAKYPPIGNRGISGQGPHTGYKSYGARHATEYAPWANENIILCPSIESLEGLENVEEIAAVEGIDMIAYGHSDLSRAAWGSPRPRAPDLQSGGAADRGGMQCPRQARSGIGGDRGADRGILAARVQGAEPSGERCEHVS